MPPASWRASEYLFLANIHPTLQGKVLAAVTEPRLVVMDTMNLWIETTRRELEARGIAVSGSGASLEIARQNAPIRRLSSGASSTRWRSATEMSIPATC